MDAVPAKILRVNYKTDKALFIVDTAGWMVYIIHSKKAYSYAAWAYEQPTEKNIWEHLISISPEDFLDNAFIGFAYQETDEKKAIKDLFLAFQEDIRKMSCAKLKTA
jgi:hypothetical protein